MSDRTADVLLIGGGPAAAACASELRAQGFDGSVLLVGREADPPYERPPISKSYLLGRSSAEDARLDVPGDVEVLTRTSAMKADWAARTVALSTKETVSFDRALVATGANVRRLRVEGSDLEGIHYLRALRNADALRADVAEGARVVLVGGSFIACEVAASLTSLGARCTLVFPEDEPLSLQFGETVGRHVRSLLEDRGVFVVSGEELESLSGEGSVRAVHCVSGASFEASTVVIGVGATPDVMLARSSGLTLGPLGGVACSSRLETSAEGVWAAGDMCEYASVVHGRPVRIEHHEVAMGQGRCVARNMLGAGEDYAEVPYFWSDLADWATLESVGPALDGWDEEVIRGSLEDGEFTVFHLREGRVVQAVTRGRSADLDDARALIVSGEPLDRDAS